MIPFNFTQLHGTNKPTNLFPQTYSNVLPQKHPREESRSDDSSADPIKSSISDTHNSKRFKPNISGPRSRLSHEKQDDVRSYNSSDISPQCCNQFISLSNASTTNDEGSQEEGGIAEGDNGEDEETGNIPLRGPASHLLQFEKNGNSENLPEDLPKNKEGSTAAATLTPPYPSEDVKSLASNQDSTNAKITKKKRIKKLEELKAAAKKEGFMLINEESENVSFRCPENHKIPSKLLNQGKITACKKCSKKYAKCQEYAKAHNGIKII